jgi:hypothetical protein
MRVNGSKNKRSLKTKNISRFPLSLNNPSIVGLPTAYPNTNSFFSIPPPPVLTRKSSVFDYVRFGVFSVHQNVEYLNNSKLFAGLIVIIINIASKFVNFKLSKTMESYLKHTFSRNVLVFCIAWMGSREIYIAIIITCMCILLMDFVCNESSGYCILPETFKTHYISLLEEKIPTPEEIKNAKEVLQRAPKEQL